MVEKKEKKTKPVEAKIIPAGKSPEEIKPEDKHEIQVIERIIENHEIAPADAFGKLTRGQVNLIKRTIAQDASDDELRLFIQVCKGARLNPFLKQAHLVPFWDSKTGTERRAIIVGIDGFRTIAEGSGNYAGNEDPVYEGESEVEVDVWEGSGKQRKITGKKKIKVPGKATVTVYKMIGGQRCPFISSARWDEYFPGTKKGARWMNMPYLMLGKCAEALALRKAFPALLSGMYAQEEMDQAMNADSDEQKQTKGFAYLKAAIKTTKSAKTLQDYRDNMEKSDKYTADQKSEYFGAIDARLDELNAVGGNEPEK